MTVTYTISGRKVIPRRDQTVVFMQDGEPRAARVVRLTAKGEIDSVRRHGVESKFTAHDRVVALYTP